jgi:N-acetylmuramoyl-L-alanine amidase
MKNRTRCTCLLVAVLLSIATMVNAKAPTIILDPGHDPLYRGALGSCGEFEFVYNDRIVTAYLKTTSERVITTRDAGQPPRILKLKTVADNVPQSRYTLKTSLKARTTLANSTKAGLFISIHHDSTASRFITPDKSICQGRGGHTLLPEFKARNDIGFNVFIDGDPKNPQYQQSLRFATLLGQELIGIGRKPSNYHYYPEDDCRSCRPVIRDLGIWHQQLYVLRNVRMPAVLVEVGNIADAEDEALVNSEKFREQFAQALKRAVDRYFAEARGD